MPTSYTLSDLPQVHGHRGCRGLFSENTLPAFLHAVRLGVPVLELDVVLSADGQVVVSHEPWMSAAICLDPAGQPIPEATQQHHNLYRMPYAEVRRYDCGQRQHPAFPEQQTLPAHKPLLHEVVAAVDQLSRELGHQLPRFSVEVKSEPAGDDRFHPAPEPYVAVVLAELNRLGLQHRTTLLSFDIRVLQEARQQQSAFALCLLVEDETPLTEHLLLLGFTPEVYGPHHDLVTPQLIAEAKLNGLQLVPWTVNNQADMRRLITLGIAGITTDYPDRLLSIYASFLHSS